MMERESIVSSLPAIVRPYEAIVFWFTECMEAYERANGEIASFPTVSAYTTAVKGFQERLTALMEVLITEIEQDMSRFVARSVLIKQHENIHPTIVPANLDVNEDIEFAKKSEENAVEHVRTVFEGYLARCEQLLNRAGAL